MCNSGKSMCINSASGFSGYVKVCLIFAVKENITYVYNALQEWFLTQKDCEIRKMLEEQRIRKNSTILPSSPRDAGTDLYKSSVIIVL